MNAVRAAHGLRPLRFDARLEGAARRHSRAMLRTGVFAHGAFTARIRSVGVRTPRIGENLAWVENGAASPTPSSVARLIVKLWLESPAHRANLLRPGYRLLGVAAPNGPFAGHPSVQMVTADFAGY